MLGFTLALPQIQVELIEETSKWQYGEEQWLQQQHQPQLQQDPLHHQHRSQELLQHQWQQGSDSSRSPQATLVSVQYLASASTQAPALTSPGWESSLAPVLPGSRGADVSPRRPQLSTRLICQVLSLFGIRPFWATGLKMDLWTCCRGVYKL